MATATEARGEAVQATGIKGTAAKTTAAATARADGKSETVERAGSLDTAGIILEDVCYEYPGGVAALKGISLRISQNETVAIIGENGAGKTTLAKHLNGLLKPTSGRVFVDGVDTRGRTCAAMARLVGFVFQNPDDQLFQNQVFKEIAFGPRNLGYPADKVERLVKWAAGLVGIEGLLERHPFDLALAQRKLVAIASVVAMDTPYVILDEPTTGQDYPGTQKLATLVAKLHAAGKTVIAITHDMEFAAAHFARVIALAGGRVILDGTPNEVFSRPDELAMASVEPPQMARLGQRLGLEECVLDQEALLRALGLV
ncbi:MAG: ABC transporter ATP-binding protein [Firmicutes bacterium]|nr:ABC transporter ATP-binding protein [Bacillota bacterium]